MKNKEMIFNKINKNNDEEINAILNSYIEETDDSLIYELNGVDLNKLWKTSIYFITLPYSNTSMQTIKDNKPCAKDHVLIPFYGKEPNEYAYNLTCLKSGKQYKNVSIIGKLQLRSNEAVYDMIGVYCKECGLIEYKDLHVLIDLSYMTTSNEIITEKDNVIINVNMHYRIVTKENTMKEKFLNNKTIFNTTTGKIYSRQQKIDYENIDHERTKECCISLKSENDVYELFDGYFIDIAENFIEIGIAIEKSINDLKAIPFKEYYNNINEIYDMWGNKKNRVSNYFKRSVLIAYNLNPYVDYEYTAIQYKLYNYSKKYPRKFEIKEFRNIHIKNKINSYLIDKMKLPKKSLQYLVKINETNTFADPIKNIITICKSDTIKDVNNMYKILEVYTQMKISTLEGELWSIWNSIYIQDLIKIHGENNVVNAILKVIKKEFSNANDYIVSTANKYKKILNKYSSYEMLVKRLRLKDLRDKIRLDYSKIDGIMYYYKYSDNMHNRFEKEIDDHYFRLVNSGEELIKIGNEFNNCVGDYRQSMADKENLIIVATNKRTNKKDICIEVNLNTSSIVQAKTCYNYVLDKYLTDLLVKYAKLTNIAIHICYDLSYDIEQTSEIIFIENKPINLSDFNTYYAKIACINGKLIKDKELLNYNEIEESCSYITERGI